MNFDAPNVFYKDYNMNGLDHQNRSGKGLDTSRTIKSLINEEIMNH